MIGREKLLAIFESLLASSDADDTEIFFHATDSGLTRYANTYIHQNIDTRNASITIRVALGKKVGIATCNSLESTTLKKCLNDALAIAGLQKENPDYPGLVGPSDYPDLETCLESTAVYGPEDRAKALVKVFSRVKDAGQNMAGAFSNGLSEVCILNSNGVRAYGAFTSATCNMVSMTDDSSGYAYGTSRNIDDLDLMSMADTAIAKARDSVNPVAIEPGNYDVILEPSAVAEILEWLSYIGMGSKAFHEGMSFLTGKIGEKVMGDNVTIYDDAVSPGGMSCPFDFEGTPKKRLEIVTDGVGKNVAYDLLWAKKEGHEPTGHGLPSGGGGRGGLPLNLVFKPGDSTREDMLKAVDKGILVTRFHYVNGLINPPEAVMTGMTRDGTFIVENGEIKKGIKNLRFTNSIVEAFRNVALTGSDLATIGAWWGDLTAMQVPALLIRDFTFSGKTEF